MSNWLDRSKEKLWFAVGSNVLILAALLIVFYPSFETNDDMAIISLVCGAKGVFDYHLVYINTAIGQILRSLYMIRQDIPWYSLLQYFLLFCSFTAITYVLNHLLKKISLLYTYVFLIFFCYEGYIHIQYTKSAGIITSAGLTLIFYALFEKKSHIVSIVCGIMLAMIGSWYRITQFVCELAIFSAVGIYFLFSLKKIAGEKWLKRLLECAAVFAVLFTLVGATYILDRKTYDTERWAYYLKYDVDRQELIDYGFPDFEKNQAAYESLGIDKNTYQLFKKWTHSDCDKITVDVMDQLIALKEKKTVNRSFFVKFIKTMAEGYIHIPAFAVFLIFLVSWILFGRHSLAEILSCIYGAGMIIVLYLYLFYRGRYLYNRVDVGIWMAAILLLVWFFDTEKKKKKILTNLTAAGGLILVCILFLSVLQKDLRYGKDPDASMKKWRDAYKEISEDRDHIYLQKVGSMGLSKGYGVWDAVPFGIAQNIYPLGGWTAQTETSLSVLDAYQIRNPFPEMIDNEKVYLIDTKIEPTMEYLKKWYNPDASEECVKSIGKIDIYRINTH